MSAKRDFETIVRELDARQQIHDCIMRYCRGTDHCDPDLMRSAYHPDATDDHGFFQGSADEFVTVAVQSGDHYEVIRHLICNEFVEFDENDPKVARAETVTVGCLLSRTEDGYALSASACRYLDRFEERDGEWKIADRRLILDFEVAGPVAGLAGNDFTKGMRRGLASTADYSFAHGFKLWGDTPRKPVVDARVGEDVT